MHMPGGREEEPREGAKGRASHAGRSTGKTPADPQGDLLQALDEYRAGHKDLDEAAAEAGVTSWDLLEAVQATPDPMVSGLDGPSGLQPFVRRRED